MKIILAYCKQSTSTLNTRLGCMLARAGTFAEHNSLHSNYSGMLQAKHKHPTHKAQRQACASGACNFRSGSSCVLLNPLSKTVSSSMKCYDCLTTFLLHWFSPTHNFNSSKPIVMESPLHNHYTPLRNSFTKAI